MSGRLVSAALLALPLAGLLTTLGGCKREHADMASTAQNATARQGAEATAPAAAAPAAPSTTPEQAPPLPGLQLYELRVEGVGEGSAGLAIDSAALRLSIARTLPGAGPFLCGHARVWAASNEKAGSADAPTTTPCPSELRRSARTGVVVAAVALAVDDMGAPATLEAATQVLLQVRVHAERGDEAGKPIIGEANVEAPLPLPEQRKGPGLAAFLAQRAASAAAIAASDAGGQLLVRELDDAAVIAWLAGAEPWRVIAALREVGERAMDTQRGAVEALARRSRPDIVTVAAATLGRIGDAGSVPILAGVLSSASAEVCDAALIGLRHLRAGRGDAANAATAALRAAADRHPLPWIRQRARSLLGSANGAGEPAAPVAPEPDRAP